MLFSFRSHEPKQQERPELDFSNAYEKCPSAMTANELLFFKVIAPLVDPYWRIFAKVRLEDICRVKQGFGKKERWGLRSRIKSRHVDFVLCDKETLEYLMVIELDDPSHNRADRKKRDRFVDQVIEGAGLTIIHVPAKFRYTADYVRQYIFE